MRWSNYLLCTLKETPAEAEIISHILMLRAGMIRKSAAGIYDFLPLGRRALRKLEQIIRDEMDKCAQEILLPILTPAELWRESGRWSLYGPELMRLRDRKETHFALGPTHEEAVTNLIRREVKSYRQLPLCVYQIQSKFRDEIRPRFGLMRGREFSMKDAYSFHRDRQSLDAFYIAMRDVYSRIFRRCGLDFRPVMADPGAIGGNETQEFMVLAESGESRILSCPDANCGFAATDEAAPCQPGVDHPLSAGGVQPNNMRPLEFIETPNRKSIEDVAAFLGVAPSQCAKALIYMAGGAPVALFIRGDRRLNEAKLRALPGCEAAELATDDAAIRAAGITPGYTGPIGLPAGARVFADASIAGLANLVVGGNRDGYHYKNANWDRDMPRPALADLTLAEAGDPCPNCGKPLVESRGVEAGQIFKLGTKYSEAMKAHFLDDDGAEKPLVMGCYGIGLTRTLAAVIEQRHDKDGIIWPISLAPFHVVITCLGDKGLVRETAERLYADLLKEGIEVLYDDRDLGPGFKLKDADLIGIPLRIVVGERGLKEGALEFKLRSRPEREKIPLDQAIPSIRARLDELWKKS